MTEELTPRQALMREAALWLTQLDSGTADLAAFEAWRDADPRHAAAIARLAGVNHALDQARPHLEPDDLASIKGGNRRSLLWGVGIAASTMLVLGGSVAWRASRASAVTGIGDRQMIAVPGGGQLDLNTDTKVYYRFSGRSHQIWLERGEIALTQAPGALPCQIIAGTDRIEFMAGKINARRLGDRLDVTVQKGNCTVHQSSDRHMTVQANEAAVVSSNTVTVHAAAEADQQFATGWQNDELVLDGQTLSQAVDEFNRYRTSQIEIGDPSLADIRLGGRFSLHDPNDFLASLQSAFGIRSIKRPDGVVVLSRN